MTYYNYDDVDLDSSYDFDSTIDVDFDFDSDVDIDLDVDKDINIDICIDGNEASFAIDLQAFGENTSVDLNVVAAVSEGEWSSITATGYAATNG